MYKRDLVVENTETEVFVDLFHYGKREECTIPGYILLNVNLYKLRILNIP